MAGNEKTSPIDHPRSYELYVEEYPTFVRIGRPEGGSVDVRPHEIDALIELLKSPRMYDEDPGT